MGRHGQGGERGRSATGRKTHTRQKDKMKLSKIISVAATVVAKSIRQITCPGTTRLFRLAGSAAAMFLLAANAWAGKPGGGAAIAAPSNLAATAFSSSQINLTWQDNAGNESGFKIERGPTSTGAWVQ